MGLRLVQQMEVVQDNGRRAGLASGDLAAVELHPAADTLCEVESGQCTDHVSLYQIPEAASH